MNRSDVASYLALLLAAGTICYLAYCPVARPKGCNCPPPIVAPPEATPEPPGPPIVEAKVTPDPISLIDGKGRMISKSLSLIAQDTAESMALANRLSHTNLRAYKQRHGALRENIAYSGDGKWETAYELWHESPPHKANINSNLTHMGYGKAIGDSGRTFFVVVYGEYP